MSKEGLTNTSTKVMVGAVKSFFKYNDLPLGMIPQAMSGIVFHNRGLTKDEIIQIMALSKIREKAFFTMMAQSGLRPHTMKQLRFKNLESLDKAPCKIDVPEEIAKGKFGSYVTFIGPDALKYLKQYLATRTNLTPESLVFCSHLDSDNPVNVKDMSRAFRLAARKLEKSDAIDYEVRQGKPSELRLYNLRKFFRKYASQMGNENVQYLMGHTVRGSDANYKPQDPEFYRELYAEKAMPFLRLETATPTETEKTIVELRKQLSERDKEIEELKISVSKIQKLTEFLNDLEPEHAAEFLRYRMDHKESLLEVPEPVAEIPITETFKKKVNALIEIKKKEKEDKISLSELFELSCEASAEEEAEARKKNQTKKHTP